MLSWRLWRLYTARTMPEIYEHMEAKKDPPAACQRVYICILVHPSYLIATMISSSISCVPASDIIAAAWSPVDQSSASACQRSPRRSSNVATSCDTSTQTRLFAYNCDCIAADGAKKLQSIAMIIMMAFILFYLPSHVLTPSAPLYGLFSASGYVYLSFLFVACRACYAVSGCIISAPV